MFQKNSINYSSSTDCTFTHKRLLNISTETYIWMNFVNLFNGILNNTNTQLIFESNAIYIQGTNEDQLRIAINKIQYIAFSEFEMLYLLKENKELKSYKPYIQLIYSQFYKDLFLTNKGICIFIKDKLLKEQIDLENKTQYSKPFDMEITQSLVVIWVPKRKSRKILAQLNRWIYENHSIQYELKPSLNQENFDDTDSFESISMNYSTALLFYMENDIQQLQIQKNALIKFIDDSQQINLIIQARYQYDCQTIKNELEKVIQSQYIELLPYEISQLSDDQILSDLQTIIQKRFQVSIKLYKLTNMYEQSRKIDAKFGTNIFNYLNSLGYQECLFFVSKSLNSAQIIKIMKDVMDLRMKYNKIIHKKSNISTRYKQKQIKLFQDRFEITFFDSENGKLLKNVFNYNDFEQYLATNFKYHYQIEVFYRHQKLNLIVTINQRLRDIREDIIQFLEEYMNYEIMFVINLQNTDFLNKISEKYDCDIEIFKSKTCARGVIETYNQEFSQIKLDNDGDAIVLHIKHLIHSNKQPLIQEIKKFMLKDLEISEIQQKNEISEEDSLFHLNQTLVMQLTDSQIKIISEEGIEINELQKGQNCLEDTYWVTLEGNQEKIANALSLVMKKEESLIQDKLKEKLLENEEDPLLLIEKSQQMEVYSAFNEDLAFKYYKELRMMKLNIRLSTEQYIYLVKSDKNLKFQINISKLDIPIPCLLQIIPVLPQINDNAIIFESYDQLQQGAYFIGIIQGINGQQFKLSNFKNKYLITHLVRIQ